MLFFIFRNWYVIFRNLHVWLLRFYSLSFLSQPLDLSSLSSFSLPSNSSVVKEREREERELRLGKNWERANKEGWNWKKFLNSSSGDSEKFEKELIWQGASWHEKHENSMNLARGSMIAWKWHDFQWFRGNSMNFCRPSIIINKLSTRLVETTSRKIN